MDVTDRNVVILSVPRDQVESPQCQHIDVSSTLAGTYATFVGLKDPGGKELRSGFPDPNLRPQIVGVFTDLIGPAPPGLKMSATIDTRFSTTPTTLKLLAMLLRDRGHHRRAGRAVAPGPVGRAPDAPVDPGALAHLHPRRRRR